MAHFIGDRVKEAASTTGTGAFTLAGAPSGFDTFASLLPTNGDTTWYCAVNAGEWEVGLCTRTSASVYARTTIFASSNADAAVNFTAAPTVFCTVPAKYLQTEVIVSARKSATQALAINTYTKINLPTEDKDTHGFFDTATSRFQPLIAGDYRLSGQVAFGSPAVVECAIYKNGTLYRAGSSTGSAYAAVVTTIVSFNGSTDYAELWGFTGLAQSTIAAAGYTYFDAELIRAA